MPDETSVQTTPPVDVIIHNGRIATQDDQRSFVQAIAIKDGKVVAVGSDQDILKLQDQPHWWRGARTQIIDVKGRTVIPGLNDSHLHIIRGGLNYNMELRWDGVPSLADALRMLKDQARRTPPPQWVRVVGGWTEFQFAERRMPTLDEINAVSPDTPVFVLHLYDRAILNGAALRACGYDKDTPDPPGAEIQRDKQGNPTGVLIAKPNAMILYQTLGKGPKLPPDEQANSTRHFMRELNRLGLTSAIDAAGGFQNYPDDYAVIEKLHKREEMTVRIAYNLFAQRPKNELADFKSWMKKTGPGEGDDYYLMNGAGENLVFSAMDFEDMLQPRPDLPDSLEEDLTKVVRLLAEHRWPFRIHATYDESIGRFLDVFEAVNRDVPFDGLRWFFDHAETISERNMERVQALAGGISVQHRMAYQGEYFVERYGAVAARHTPPIVKMLGMGLPVGAGTDATRVASYNPWVSLYWLVTGKTVGGTPLYPEANRLDRMEALRRYTVASAWFSGEQGKKGALVPGQLADLAVLSADYFSVPDEEIKAIESVLTLVGGKVVYGAGEFADLAPEPLPVLPDWSPVKVYGGYHQPAQEAVASTQAHACAHGAHGLLHRLLGSMRRGGPEPLWGGLGCDCFAF
ncbi:MAG: amidohydrolase [Planctomycetaceae bacterium]|nr:amidohydrolase [Planctomycetaceae bacterium]